MYSSMEVDNAPARKAERSPDKWVHDKFDELERDIEQMKKNGTKPGAAFVSKNMRAQVNTARGGVVKVLVTNLASTVCLEDLKDLFAEYNAKNVVLHHNEKGQSLGSATFDVSREGFSSIKENLGGVLLDGKELIFHETIKAEENRSIHSRLSKVSDNSKRRFKPEKDSFAKRNVARQTEPSSLNRRVNYQGTSKPKPKKLTLEELDAELDEYMKNR